MKKYPLVFYFVFVYAFTFGIAFLVKTPGDVIPQIVKTILAPFYRWGPAFAAVILVWGKDRSIGVKQLFATIKLWRIGWKWYLFIAIFPIAARLAAVGAAWVLGEQPTNLFFNQVGLGINNLWLAGLLYFIGVFIQAGLAEEIGWRGYALPRLLKKYNAVTASIILGLLWAGWHFHPINIDAYRESIPWFTVQTICISIIFTWVYLHTNRSLLAAVLFHTFINFSDWIVPISPILQGSNTSLAIWIFRGIILLVTVLLCILSGKNLTLSKNIETQKLNQEIVL